MFKSLPKNVQFSLQKYSIFPKNNTFRIKILQMRLWSPVKTDGRIFPYILIFLINLWDILILVGNPATDSLNNEKFC